MLIARCSLFCCSCRARRVHAIRIQHVVQSYDPFQLMNIGPIDYRQNVYVGFAHALQREIQGMVSMDMGKVQGVQKINQILFCFSVRQSAFDPRPAQNTNNASVVHQRPGAEFTRPRAFVRLLNSHLRR